MCPETDAHAIKEQELITERQTLCGHLILLSGGYMECDWIYILYQTCTLEYSG